MEKNTIGNRLRELRYNMDLTQEELGEKSGLHYSYIGQVERGDKIPSLKSLMKIGEALNISLEEIIKTEELKPEQITNNKLKSIHKMLSNRSAQELELIKNLLKEILGFLDSLEEQSKNYPDND
ncbi:MAG: helix-turn-helix domain-containing protein [Bacillota bacterium]